MHHNFHSLMIRKNVALNTNTSIAKRHPINKLLTQDPVGVVHSRRYLISPAIILEILLPAGPWVKIKYFQEFSRQSIVIDRDQVMNHQFSISIWFPHSLVQGYKKRYTMQKLLQKRNNKNTVFLSVLFYLKRIIERIRSSGVRVSLKSRQTSLAIFSDVSLSPRPQWASSRLARPAVVVMKAGGVTQC